MLRFGGKVNRRLKIPKRLEKRSALTSKRENNHLPKGKGEESVQQGKNRVGGGSRRRTAPAQTGT